MKKKKILLGLGTISVIGAPVAAVVSCGVNPRSDKGYSFGLAVPAVSSLNYVKFESSVDVASPLVEGLFKGGPEKNSAISNYLKLDDVEFASYNKKGQWEGSHPIASNYGYQSGTLRRKVGSRGVAVGVVINDKGTSDRYWLSLHGKSEWENGEAVKASDFIDGLVSILDLNSGSQRINSVYKLKIRGVRNFINAQNEYAQVFGVTYKNPFGYVYKPLPKNATKEVKRVWTYYQQDLEKGFPLQNTEHERKDEEQKYVNQIKVAASEIGVYGDKYSSHPHPDGEVVGWIAKTESNSIEAQEEVEYGNGVIKPFTLDIRNETDNEPFTIIVNGIAMRAKILLPINKRFIESLPGKIEDFGKSKETFLSAGPFVVDQLVLGINGNMIIQKNTNYWGVKEILPNSVKLFFQTDPVVIGTLFEDGYISYAKINSIYTKKFFSSMQYRALIKKSGGWGMTGLVMNIDKNANKNKHFLNPIFRKALLLAIDRKEIIKMSGFDTSTPSYSIMEPTVGIHSFMAPNRGVSIGNSFADETINYSDDFAAPIIAASSLKSQSIGQLFVNTDQTDRVRNVDLAKKLFKQYKKENNIKGPIKIEFLNDSTQFMINMGIGIKSQFKEVFGDDIVLEIKNLPKSIYESFVASGNFEFTWKNLDHLDSGTTAGGVDAFMVPDGIDKAVMKTTGFVSNPAGSWTIQDAFKYYVDSNTEEKARKRLKITKKHWDKLKEITKIPNIVGNTKAQNETLLKKRLNAFIDRATIKLEDLPISLRKNGNWNTVDPDYDTTNEMVRIMLAANKIIMDQAAVIPIFRVDVTIKIDRLPHVLYETAQHGYGYLYDLIRKPRPDLPGMEVKGL